MKGCMYAENRACFNTPEERPNYSLGDSIVADELLDLLDTAIDAITTLEDTGWSSYSKPEDFLADLRALRDAVANGDRDAAQRLRHLFAPTGEWDDCVGPGRAAGQLANRISELLQRRLDA